MKPQQRGRLETLHFSRANFGRTERMPKEVKQEKAIEEKATEEIESVQR